MRNCTRLLVTLAFVVATGSAPVHARSACLAPLEVCDVREAVFHIKSFDPYGSAVRIDSDLLVTNRHVVADEKSVTVITETGEVLAEVIPTSFRGDLVLLKTKLPDGPIARLRDTPLTDEERLRTVGYDLAQRAVRVYIDGMVLAQPRDSHPLSRLHHTAHTQPGNSGGAVVDDSGRVVGIATSGGAGIFEAVPAKSLALLRAKSGQNHANVSARIGANYRTCILATEAARRHRTKLPLPVATPLENDCLATENRQLIALAGQAFGQTRDFATSERMLAQALALDPNAINSRLSLATTLLYARKPEKALPHVRRLLTRLPENLTVQRMSIQAGKMADDPELVEAALDAIRQHNPKGLVAAQRFLKMQPRQRLRKEKNQN